MRFARLVSYVRDALTIDGTLSATETGRRREFLSMAVCAFVLLLIGGSGRQGWTHQVVSSVVFVVVLATLAVSIVFVLCKRPLSTKAILTFGGIVTTSILIADLNARTIQYEWWPMLVLCVDYLLVMRVHERYSLYVVCVTVLWLVLMSCEESYRFGLLDLPGLLVQEGKKGRKEYFRRMTECEAPPCAMGFPPKSSLISITVLVLDFIATRGFARTVLAEQASMERTIDTVHDIAVLLASYDTQGVADMLLAKEGQLPGKMHRTLGTMEQNLRKYRPYLPAALFEVDEESPGRGVSVVSMPPGADSGEATLVFTDICASTQVWECAPEGMRAGLRIHNAVVRGVMETFGGYEVKTIGDAFMVAFASTMDGVGFALRVQELLFEAEWPPSLLDTVMCAEQDLLWCGLNVRIGVNSGPVTVEHNTLTGRADYFGHTVNVASRLESTCVPGAVAVPSELWVSACTSCEAVLGQAEALDLKGVSGTTFVHCVWPTSLAGRRHAPLRGRRCTDNQVLESDSNSLSLLAPTFARQTSGTVGVAEIAAADKDSVVVLHTMSTALSAVTVALDQCGGVVVSLFANYVCFGWNLSRSAPAHMESAVRFAQRTRSTPSVSGTGIVSGDLQHGDVAARRQRFVTVVGSIVDRSWDLCQAAVRRGIPCLYAPPHGAVLPFSLEHELSPDSQHPGVYSVK